MSEQVPNVEAEAPAATPPVESPQEPAVQERVVERVIEKQVEPETRREKIERERSELHADLAKVFQKNKAAQEAIDNGEPLPDEKPRNEKGEFTAKDGTQKAKEPEGKVVAKGSPEPADSKEPELPLETAQEAKPAEVKPSHDIKPPDHWDASLKDSFTKLEESVAKQIAEAGLKDRQNISKLGNQLRDLEPILNTLKSHETQFSQAGMTVQQGIDELMRAHRALNENPTQALRSLAQRFNVDLWNLADGTGQEASADPNVNQLRSELNDLKAQLAASQQAQTAQLQTQQESQAVQIQRAIDDFAKDKPDFARLESLIVTEIHAIKATSPHLSDAEVLAKAYEHAELLHPEVRAEREAARLAKLEKERVEKAAQQAEQARKAVSVNVISSPDEGKGQVDLRDQLRSVWRKKHS